MKSNADILQTLYQVILERKANPSENSYTASLMQKGIDKILKKLGEEATELVIAAKGGERDETVYEAADLLYHTLVLLAYCDIPLDDVLTELRRRFGISGIEEKAARTAV
jgi:phosphoribosyl-ATP pyrophosphohydrolase